MNSDNYNNSILETIFYHDTNYELIKDNFGGYYVNIHYKGINKREIIAKFQNPNSDDSKNFFFAKIFWDGLKEKIERYS